MCVKPIDRHVSIRTTDIARVQRAAPARRSRIIADPEVQLVSGMPARWVVPAGGVASALSRRVW
ncbi:MAG: hypothetical protein ACC726_16860 [Chloroflexota bacterium]